MSLSIFVIDESGSDLDIPSPSHGGDVRLFGFENYRSLLWGSSELTLIGCKLLPLLKHEDVWINSLEDADVLRHEAILILDNLNELSAKLKLVVSREKLEFYLKNLLHGLDFVALVPGRRLYIG